MARKSTLKTDAKETLAELISISGMTQSEALDYLQSKGIRVTLGSLKSWLRGLYTPPQTAYEEMWLVVRALFDDERELPEGVPESVQTRRAIILGMSVWWDEQHPDLEWQAFEEESEAYYAESRK